MVQKKNNKLIYNVSLLLIIGFVATSLASFYVSRAALRSQIESSVLPLTGDNINAKIQRDLLLSVNLSSFMAQSTFLKDWVMQGEKDIDKITQYLSGIKKQYNTTSSFFVSDKTRIYYYEKGAFRKLKQEDTDDLWYFRVRSMKTDYEINVDTDKANNQSMTIFINYRVYDNENNFIGATGVGLTVNFMENMIKEYQNKYNRNIYLTDEKGNLKLSGVNQADRVNNINNIQGISNHADEVLSKKINYLRYKKNGKTAHVSIRYLPELKWFLLVEQVEKKWTSEIFSTILANFIVCAVISICILILTYMTISSFQTKLEKLASTDGLTGIYNRHSFDILMAQIMKDSARKKFDWSIISFDIDFFKKINDEYGHPAGDKVLKHIVSLTQDFLRESDAFCRWGGEEFLIVLKECNLDDAYLIAEKIRKAVAGTSVVYKGNEIGFKISLGVAQFHPGEDQECLFYRVDKLLYLAKDNGRNRSEKESSV